MARSESLSESSKLLLLVVVVVVVLLLLLVVVVVLLWWWWCKVVEDRTTVSMRVSKESVTITDKDLVQLWVGIHT